MMSGDAPRARRTIEEVVADHEGAGSSSSPRPWPIHGEPVGPFDEDRYRRACDARTVPTHVLCLRRHLMAQDDGAFVAAAFRVMTGHEPERSVWQYHMNQLASGKESRDKLLDALRKTPEAEARRVILFDDGQVRPLVEAVGLGLQDVLRLLVGLTRRQVRRRFAMGVRRALGRPQP